MHLASITSPVIGFLVGAITESSEIICPFYAFSLDGIGAMELVYCL